MTLGTGLLLWIEPVRLEESLFFFRVEQVVSSDILQSVRPARMKYKSLALGGEAILQSIDNMGDSSFV